MAQRKKVGRNDRCPCGSGKKYKLCCEAKQKDDQKSRVWMMVLGGILVAGLIYAAATFEVGEAPRRVWSEEHQHYHTE